MPNYSALTRGLFWCLYPELRSNEGNKYQNYTRVSAETVRTRVHTLSYFLRDIHKLRCKRRSSHIVHVSHLLGFRPADDELLVTSQWPDNYDAITWMVISNSLIVDFIHGDIHGRSCKKPLAKIQNCFSSKPILEPMLTQIYVAIWHHKVALS